MTADELSEIIQQGENSSVEFKEDGVRPDSLAREMVAFANGSGGVVCIGITDSGQVSGVDLTRITEEWVMNISRTNIVPPLQVGYEQIPFCDNVVVLITIPKGTDKPYQSDQRYLIRVGSTNRTATQTELMRLFQVAGVFHYDGVPIPATGMADLNMAALDTYFSPYHLEFSREAEETRRTLLKNTDILTESGETTLAGMLLFGMNPARYLSQSGIAFAHYAGNEIGDELIDKQILEGVLPFQVDSALACIRHNIRRPSRIEGGRRTESANLLPERVFRELVVNAIVHRNYAIAGSRIRIFMFSDRIEFISPGRLPNTVTIDKLRAGVSYAANPIIVKFMENMGYMDRLGRGFPLVIHEVSKQGGDVAVRELGEELRVTITWEH